MTHDLNLIGFKCGKYAVVFLHCANLAELELSPRIPFPIWFSVGFGQKRDFCEAGKVEAKLSHYEPKVLVVTDDERMWQVHPHGLVRVQISFTNAVLTSGDSRLTSKCGVKSLWPLSLHPSLWSHPAAGYSPVCPHTPGLHAGGPFSLILRHLSDW